MDEAQWRERAQSCEARYSTLEQNVDRVKEDARYVLETFCAKKKSDGSFEIDWDGFIERIGEDQSIALIQIINEKYGSSGNIESVA